MKAVIFHGDDFGLAPAINQGILQAHRQGCLTSASLSVAGPAAEEAAAAAHECKSLGIGLHLTLVDELPVSDPAKVPSLLDRNGRLWPSGLVFARRWATLRIRVEEVRHEIRAQLDRARDLGLSLTHVDSHDHVHVLPGLFEILLEEMDRVGLRRLRIPLETKAIGSASTTRRLAGLGLGLLARRARRIATRRGFAFPNRFLGYRGAGQIDTESLLARIRSVRTGVTEIALHPAVGSGLPRDDFAGWGYRWDAELAALLAPEVDDLVESMELRPITFRELPLPPNSVPASQAPQHAREDARE